jgi:hypothetical protein
VAVWSGRPLRLRWERPLLAQDAIWMGGLIAASGAGHQTVLLDGVSGAVRARRTA